MPSRSDRSGSRFGAFDAARPCDVDFVVRCGGAQGLASLVARVESAAGGTPRTFVAVGRDHRADYAIEATHARRGDRLQLDALTVRVKLETESMERAHEIASSALGEFGGNGYVALGAARGAARTGFEATVCFPDLVPWLAQNTLVMPRLFALDDVAAFSRALCLFGVRHVQAGRTLELSSYQLRLRPRRERVMGAFEAVVRAGYRASVYAAALPVTRSARIEQRGTELDVAITRGLSRAPCSDTDLAQMSRFLIDSFGFGASAFDLRVRAAGVPTKAPKTRALRVIEGGRSARA